MPKYTIVETRTHDFVYEVEADSPLQAVTRIQKGEVETTDEQPCFAEFLVTDESGNEVTL